MRLTRPIAIAWLALLCSLFAGPSISLAHERRTLAGGKYDVVVGWDTEPAYVNQKNAAGIRISRAGTNPAEPVLGADVTLKVEISQGAEAKSFDLRRVFGQPGYYVADLIPTRDGNYAWTFSGSIGADQVNETFDSANGEFDAVAASTGVQFPISAPDPAQVNAELQTAQAAVQTAQTMGMLGLGLGALALLAVIAMWLTRPRANSTTIGSSRRALGERF